MQKELSLCLQNSVILREFDNPLIKKPRDAAGLPCIVVEVDRQMENFERGTHDDRDI